MKFSKLKKIIIAITLIIVVICAIPLKLNATTTDPTPVQSPTISGFDDWQQQAKDFINRGNEDAKITTSAAIAAFVPIGKVLVGIGTIVLVVVGLIFGIRYMISGANEKAGLKQKLIYYVISVVLIYGAVGIFSIVISVMNNIVG